MACRSPQRQRSAVPTNSPSRTATKPSACAKACAQSASRCGQRSAADIRVRAAGHRRSSIESPRHPQRRQLVTVEALQDSLARGKHAAILDDNVAPHQFEITPACNSQASAASPPVSTFAAARRPLTHTNAAPSCLASIVPIPLHVNPPTCKSSTRDRSSCPRATSSAASASRTPPASPCFALPTARRMPNRPSPMPPWSTPRCRTHGMPGAAATGRAARRASGRGCCAAWPTWSRPIGHARAARSRGSTRPVRDAAAWDVPVHRRGPALLRRYADKLGGEVAATHHDHLGMVVAEPTAWSARSRRGTSRS